MDLRELYLNGMSYEEYLNSKGEAEKLKSEKVYNELNVKEENIERIKAVNREINILAFAEIWCPDCIINVPALKKISKVNSLIQFTIIGREGNEVYLEDYKEEGKAKVPTFIVMNSCYEVLGAFIERPRVIKDIEVCGDQVKVIVEKRNYRAGKYINECIEEILDIIS
ncbi:MAG: thioredoxin family protein [Clostridium sp.]